MQHHNAVYIVSWTGQHVRAGNIYKALLDNPNIERIKIVYSDRNPQLRFKEKFDTILTGMVNQMFSQCSCLYRAFAGSD